MKRRFTPLSFVQSVIPAVQGPILLIKYFAPTWVRRKSYSILMLIFLTINWMKIETYGDVNITFIPSYHFFVHTGQSATTNKIDKIR